MPNLNGVEAAQRIHEILPDSAIVILSMHSDEAMRSARRPAREETLDYLLKDSAEGDLIEAIHRVSMTNIFQPRDQPHAGGRLCAGDPHARIRRQL